MIIVIGKITAKADHVDDVTRLSLDHVKRSRLEAGCISHDVSIDPEHVTKFTFVEYWTDMPALLTHFGLEASKGFVRDLIPYLTDKPDMKTYQADEILLG